MSRLPGDRSLDKLAGGILWRKVLARIIVTLFALLFMAGFMAATGAPLQVAGSVLMIVVVIGSALSWASENWNG